MSNLESKQTDRIINNILDLRKLETLQKDVMSRLSMGVAETTARLAYETNTVQLIKFDCGRYIFIHGVDWSKVQEGVAYIEDGVTKSYVDLTAQSEFGTVVYIKALWKGNTVVGWLTWSGGVFCDKGSFKPVAWSSKRSAVRAFCSYIKQLSHFENINQMPTYFVHAKHHVASWLSRDREFAVLSERKHNG